MRFFISINEVIKAIKRFLRNSYESTYLKKVLNMFQTNCFSSLKSSQIMVNMLMTAFEQPYKTKGNLTSGEEWECRKLGDPHYSQEDKILSLTLAKFNFLKF
jgi:hypothetical protein